MALKSAWSNTSHWLSTADTMAKWFKEFPINLKNGTDRIRSSSESGSTKSGIVVGVGTKGSKGSKNSSVDSGGVGSLLSGRNRKNSAIELGKNGTGSSRSTKDGKVWDSLLSGKSRKNSKAETATEHEQNRPLKSCSTYINRLIRVDKQDKTPNFNSGTTTGQVVSEVDKLQMQYKSERVFVLEDYADPFDAQKTREQREAERVGENDGYMEPYDAQQLITEIRQRGSKDMVKPAMLSEVGAVEESQSVPLQIYDTPYEGDSDSDGAKTPVTRQELDPRPATEYELHWDWKKEHIARTLSALSDSPEHTALTKDNTTHLTHTKQHQQLPSQWQQHQRHKSWTQKILKSTSTLSPPSIHSSSPETEARHIDPTLPLEKQIWYHGCVSRQEAEFHLQSCKEASFLVRNSESGTSKYSIALKTSHGYVHIIVAQTKESGYTLDQSSCVFPSIPEVVHHYCRERLPFNGAEHMTLRHPVSRIH